MEQVGTYLFAIATVLLGVFLMTLHHRRWLRTLADSLDPKNLNLLGSGATDLVELPEDCSARLDDIQDELRFAYLQYRRRMQTSGMLFPLGIFIALAGLLVRSYTWFIATIVVLLLLIGWLVLLAVADMVASHMHYSRKRQLGKKTPLDPKTIEAMTEEEDDKGE